MPLGEIIAEAVGTLLVEVIWQGLVESVLWPIIRFPGAFLGWCIWRQRAFTKVWNKEDKVAQTLAGLAIWIVLVLILTIH